MGWLNAECGTTIHRRTQDWIARPIKDCTAYRTVVYDHVQSRRGVRRLTA